MSDGDEVKCSGRRWAMATFPTLRQAIRVKSFRGMKSLNEGKKVTSTHDDCWRPTDAVADEKIHQNPPLLCTTIPHIT